MCWRISHLCTDMPGDNTSAPHMCWITTQAHPIIMLVNICITLACTHAGNWV